MDLNLQLVSDDPQAQELMREIMTEIGLPKEASHYDGDSAFEKRCQAAANLPAAIQQKHDAGRGIHEPVEDLLKFARSCSNNLERDRLTLQLTHAVIEVIIYGHIWMGRLNRSFNRSMARQGTESRLMSMVGLGAVSGGGSCSQSGSCDPDDCGGCGSGGGGCGGCGP